MLIFWCHTQQCAAITPPDCTQESHLHRRLGEPYGMPGVTFRQVNTLLLAVLLLWPPNSSSKWSYCVIASLQHCGVHRVRGERKGGLLGHIS